ncbi:hypothetical protein IWQ56_001895 [Coemansia nantahalensis]|uniref:Uncharacterized protein n=1 Tax=Coemansia nantahalensis TaxID=2789366 RepID=A0ACC1JL92_9FUNG|nr:hypothetical protein IWQ57_005980 [Coemansia nantahalensis]KAJ2771164.1 hypothetical protein IWQ56_001895 [Coemansia nantahalensis]
MHPRLVLSFLSKLAVAAHMAAGYAPATRRAQGVHTFSNPGFAGALNDRQLDKLAAAARSERGWLDIRAGELLAPILVPRQIGTPGYRQTQELIVTTLRQLGYAISWDNFTATTPVGAVPMANIIATRNPGAAKRLVLSAHYESKIVAGGAFVGATDSAVPVALMLDVARGLAKRIDQQPSADVSLQLVFFDGEEAYVEWNHTDSIYGSRHLAEVWEARPDPATVAALSTAAKHVPELGRVDLMVLLDLIGASDTAFLPLEAPTAQLFSQLSSLETRLHSAGHISRTYLNTNFAPGSGGVDDDHRPFVERNVPVLHLISVPFPRVWHKLADNADALDASVIQDMSVLVRSFVASYLRLGV